MSVDSVVRRAWLSFGAIGLTRMVVTWGWYVACERLWWGGWHATVSVLMLVIVVASRGLSTFHRAVVIQAVGGTSLYQTLRALRVRGGLLVRIALVAAAVDCAVGIAVIQALSHPGWGGDELQMAEIALCVGVCGVNGGLGVTTGFTIRAGMGFSDALAAGWTALRGRRTRYLASRFAPAAVACLAAYLHTLNNDHVAGFVIVSAWTVAAVVSLDAVIEARWIEMLIPPSRQLDLMGRVSRAARDA